MPGFTLPTTLPLSWESWFYYYGNDRQVKLRVWIGRPDGVTWQEITDYVVRVRVNLGDVSGIGTGQSGGDSVVRQAEIELINNRPEVDSLHPRDQSSSWNLFDADGDGVAEYAPLLWPGRAVWIQAGVSFIGSDYTNWYDVFYGYLGDSIQGTSESGRITLEARDPAKLLQDTYIETVRTYGSDAGTPAETVIQQILDDNLGAEAPMLYVPVSPGFMITPYKVEYQTVWDAIQQIAAQIGWWLGYRYWPELGQWRLSLIEPPRAKGPSTYEWSLTDDDVQVQELDITDRNVRNVITVVYRDKATDNRASVTVSDADSIAEYRRRAMMIEEADASLIDTAAEAQALAEAALSDLKDLSATTRITMPLSPWIDLFDSIQITNPRLSSTSDVYAVESVEHTFDADGGRYRTEVVASGRVIGARLKWLQMETRPGAGGNPHRVQAPVAKVTITAPPTPTVNVSPLARAFRATWDIPGGFDWLHTELEYDTDSAFSNPTRITVKAAEITVTNLQPSITYYVRARHIDTSGNYSPWSASVSVTTNDDPAGEILKVQNLDTELTTTSTAYVNTDLSLTVTVKPNQKLIFIFMASVSNDGGYEVEGYISVNLVEIWQQYKGGYYKGPAGGWGTLAFTWEYENTSNSDVSITGTVVWRTGGSTARMRIGRRLIAIIVPTEPPPPPLYI